MTKFKDKFTWTVFVFKSRLQCRALRASSLRVVYAYQAAKNKVIFLEIFFKGKKENENSKRWKEFIAGSVDPKGWCSF